jgi:TonB-like protein
MKNHRLRSILFIVALVTALAAGAQIQESQVQQSKVALPRVSAAGVPLYPLQAYISNIEGVVRLKITTDGHRVVDTHVEDGHKLLASAAEENVRTWQFQVHEPTTFTVTYRYKLVTNWKGDPYNPAVVLRLPTEVEVSTRRSPGTVDLPAHTTTAH